MASAFNLTAELNLRGPTNVRQVVSQIRKQIGTIDATVNVKVNPNTTRNVTQLNASLVALNKNLKNVKGSASAAARAMQQFSQAAGGRSVSQASQQINQVTQSLSNVSSSTGNAARNLKAATSQMEEFGKQSALAVRRFAAFSLVTTGIYALNNALVRGISSFIDYNKEIIRLQQVTGDGANAIGKLEARISNLATSLGVSSSELTKISVTLAQAGLRSREASQALNALAKSALAPTFDDLNRTVEGSIALMKQFGIGADQLESALGSINAVSAKFAVEAGDIIGAVQRAGGVFASSSKGVSQGIDALQEFIAVFTSVRATTRESAETISTGLRTIFTRLQRESTITALKEFGVNLQDTEGKFVGVYKAVELLSKGLGGLDPRDIRFSKIVEELGGFRQIGKVIPLLQQFTTAQNALSVAQRGQGSLAKDAALAQLSLANQISKVREEFLSLVREIGATDSFQVLVKGALSVSSAMISIADSVKGLIPILGSVLAFKGIGALGNFAKGFGGGLRRNAAGGAIQKYARGGVVGGSGSGDTVPAMLEPGEFVIRKKAVQAVGMQNLSRMNRYSYGGPISFKKVTGARQGGKSLASRLSTTKKDAYKQGALINEGDMFSQKINEKEFTSKSIGDFLKKKKGAAFTIRKLADSNQNVRGAEFENFIESYVAGAGTRTTGNAPLDFVGPPGEAKFQKKAVLYPDLVSKALRQRIDSGKFASLRDSKGGSPSESVQSFDNIYSAGVNLFKLEGDFDAKIARDAAGLNKKKKAETEKNKQKNRSTRNYFGGTIRRFATGGSSEDTVPALLTPGEFVVNKKAAKSLGAAKLNNLNRADRVKGYNKGGFVGVQKFNTGGGVDPEIDKFATQSLKQGSATGPSIDLQKLEKSITGIGKATTLTTGRLQKYATTLSVSGDLLNDVAGRLGQNNTQFDLLRQNANGAALSFQQVESAIMADIQALKRQGASLVEVQQKEDALARLRDTKSAATNRLVEQRSAILSNTILNSVKRAGDRISSIPLVGGAGKFASSVGRGISGQAGFFAGSAISMLGGAGESIFGDREGSEANARNVTGFERATTQAGTGLAIAGQVAMIPGIGPAAAGVIAFGTAIYAAADFIGDFSGAQEDAARELRRSKAADALDKATKGVSRALSNFEADIDDVGLESRLINALAAQNPALAASASTSFEGLLNNKRNEEFESGTFAERVGRFITLGIGTSRRNTLGAPELKEFAATQAAAARESAVAAQQVMLQQMRRGQAVTTTVEKTIARTDQSVQLQMAMAYNKALEEGKSETEARAAGEAALTKAMAEGGIAAVEAAKNQAEMTMKMEEAAKATMRLSFSLNQLTQTVGDAVNRFMFETDQARNARSVRADRLDGQASMRDTRFRATNVLENPGAYSRRDIMDSASFASSFIPGRAGRSARNTAIAGSFIDRNPNLTVQSAMVGQGNIGGDKLADRMRTRQATASARIRNPEQKQVFDDIMTTAIQAGEAAAEANRKTSGSDAASERLAFEDAFNKSLREQQEKASAPLIQILNALEKELNAFSKEVQASGKRLEEARRFRQKADDIGTDFELELRKVMTGVDASFGETALISARRTGRDTGGRTDPFAILENIERLNKKSEDLEAKRDRAATTDTDAYAKHTLELDENNRELARNKAALERLASSGELAAAALRDLSEIRALQDQTINQAKGILTRSPEENLRNFRADQRLAQFQQTGRLESNTVEARAAARDAFQRSGGDPRQARLAFENVRAQQRAEIFDSLDRQRASRELNKRNERADFILERRKNLGITGPLTAEQRADEQQALKDKGLTDVQIRDEFNREQANVMRQMGAQMGLTPENAPEFFRAIKRLEDPSTDSAARLAEQEAKDASEMQRKANEAMAQLNENMANLPAVLESLSSSIANLETYLTSQGQGQVRQPVQNRPAPGSGQPIVTKASGGVVKPIYAEQGTYVKYEPKGPDRIPAMLADGEYVLKQDAVSEIGVRNLDILNKTGSLSQAMYGNKGGLITAKGFVRGGLAMMDFDNDPQGRGIIGQTNSRAKQMASAESERHFAETGDREAANQIYKDSYSKYGGYDMSQRIDPDDVYNSNNEYRNLMLQSSEERLMHHEEMQMHKEGMAISRDQLRMANTEEQKEHHKRSLAESRNEYMRLHKEGPRTTAYDEMFTAEARKAREEQANKDYSAGVNFAKTQTEKQKEAERIKTEQAADAANDARLAQASADYNQAQAERQAREQNAIKQGFIQPDQISGVQTFYTDSGHSRHGSFHKYDPETGLIHFDTRDPQTLEITGSATVPFDRLDKDSYRRVYEQYEKQQEKLALEQYYRDEERKRQEAQIREGVGQMMEMLPSVPGMMYDNFIQKPMDAGAHIFENMKQTAAAQQKAKEEKAAAKQAEINNAVVPGMFRTTAPAPPTATAPLSSEQPSQVLPFTNGMTMKDFAIESRYRDKERMPDIFEKLEAGTRSIPRVGNFIANTIGGSEELFETAGAGIQALLYKAGRGPLRAIGGSNFLSDAGAEGYIVQDQYATKMGDLKSRLADLKGYRSLSMLSPAGVLSSEYSSSVDKEISALEAQINKTYSEHQDYLKKNNLEGGGLETLGSGAGAAIPYFIAPDATELAARGAMKAPSFLRRSVRGAINTASDAVTHIRNTSNAIDAANAARSTNRTAALLRERQAAINFAKRSGVPDEKIRELVEAGDDEAGALAVLGNLFQEGAGTSGLKTIRDRFLAHDAKKPFATMDFLTGRHFGFDSETARIVASNLDTDPQIAAQQLQRLYDNPYQETMVESMRQNFFNNATQQGRIPYQKSHPAGPPTIFSNPSSPLTSPQLPATPTPVAPAPTTSGSLQRPGKVTTFVGNVKEVVKKPFRKSKSRANREATEKLTNLGQMVAEPRNPRVEEIYNAMLDYKTFNPSKDYPKHIREHYTFKNPKDRAQNQLYRHERDLRGRYKPTPGKTALEINVDPSKGGIRRGKLTSQGKRTLHHERLHVLSDLLQEGKLDVNDAAAVDAFVKKYKLGDMGINADMVRYMGDTGPGIDSLTAVRKTKPSGSQVTQKQADAYSLRQSLPMIIEEARIAKIHGLDLFGHKKGASGSFLSRVNQYIENSVKVNDATRFKKRLREIQASGDEQELFMLLEQLPKGKRLSQALQTPYKGEIPKFANGGYVGIGNNMAKPKGTDTILANIANSNMNAALSPDEFVVRAPQARKFGGLLNDINNGKLQSSNMTRYLSQGGFIKPGYYNIGGAVGGVSNNIAQPNISIDTTALDNLASQLTNLQEFVGQLGEHVNTFAQGTQTFAGSTEMYNQGVSQYSESVDNMPNELIAKGDYTVKTQHYGLERVTDNVSQNILAQADQNSSLTNHNSMARLDRTEFEGGLNTSRNSTPMGGGQYS